MARNLAKTGGDFADVPVSGDAIGARGAGLGLSRPAVELGRARLEALRTKGDGDLDQCALYRLYDPPGDPR